MKYGLHPTPVGISILNTKSNSWRYFTTANGLVDDVDLKMKLDNDTLWLAALNGFGKYDFKTGEWTSWKEGAGILFSEVRDFVFNDDFVWIYIDPPAYSLNGSRGGVLRLDKRSLTWQDLPFNNQLFTDVTIFDGPFLYLDNNYLYALDGEKIYRQDIASGRLEVFDNNEDNLIKFHIGAKKYNNKYWYFDYDNRIVIEDAQGTNRDLIDTNFLDQHCPSLAGEEEGYTKEFNFEGNILWFGCRQGFARYDVDSKSWNYKETKSNYPAEIYNILAVRNGVLLVDSNLGLGLVKPEKQEWVLIKFSENNHVGNFGSAVWKGDNIYFDEVYPQTLWQYNTVSRTLSQIEIPESLSPKLIDLDINKNLWIFTNKFQEFNPASGEVISYEPTENIHFIFDVAKRDNEIWFTSDKGLGKFDLLTKNYEMIGRPPFAVAGVGNLIIVKDKIWTHSLVEEDRGLYIYDLLTKKWENLTPANSNLRFGGISNLIMAGDYIMIASYGEVNVNYRRRGDTSLIFRNDTSTPTYRQGGLDVYNIKNNVWRFFTSEDGMLSGHISSIHVDGDSVWFSSLVDGIWKLNVDRLQEQ